MKLTTKADHNGTRQSRCPAQPSQTGIVAAYHLSPGARALADRERLGWVDESGAAEISGEGGMHQRADQGRAGAHFVARADWAPLDCNHSMTFCCCVPSPAAVSSGVPSA